MASVAISFALSAAVGGISSLFAPKPKKPPPIDRGKLDDARFSIPALGAAIPKGWGTFRCAPIWIDHTPTVHTVQVTPGQGGGGGKGGGGAQPTPDERKHIYTKSVIGVFHNGLIHKGVSKMWFNDKLVYNADLAKNEADTSATRYEAEHGVLGGGASVTNQAECSGGKKVTGLGSGGHVTINCDTTAAGSYEIAAYYTSTVDRTFKVSVNGGGLNDLFCPASGGAGEVTSEVIKLTLLNGANTIKFENSGAACPDLDRIDITPALVFTDGEDRRGFTGIIRPGAFGPDNLDYGWPTTNEFPVFSEAEGGVTNGGFYQANLADWGNPTIRFYNGSELQDADPIIIALRGIDNAPGYRGLGILAIDNIQLDSNGQMPNVTLEVQQGMREVAAIVRDIYNEVGVSAENLDLTALEGLVLGDSSGFNPGSYTANTWTSLTNVTTGANGAITRTGGTNNSFSGHAWNGDTITAGSDYAIRFTPKAGGTFIIGFSTSTTPSGSLPHPYDQIVFGVQINYQSTEPVDYRIHMSLGGSDKSGGVGIWAPGDKFQVEIRNGRCAAYQNGLMLTGFTPPVPAFPLFPVFAGYVINGGVTESYFASGANIGTEPIISNGGGLFMESPAPAAELIQALMLRFQFSLPEVDGKVKAVLNNATSDLTIPYTELRAHRGERPLEDMVITRVDPLTLSKRTTVTYSDPALSYHTRTQSEIRLFGPQQGANDVTLPMIETAQNMKNLAIIISNREEIEGQTYTFQLGPKYMRIHQGTVLTINSRSSVAHTVRVKEVGLELPAGIVDVEAVRQDASVFSANGTPSDVGVESPIVPVPGNTKGVMIDGPLLRPEDAGDGTQPVVYIAMCGRGSGAWPGGFLHKEFPAASGNYSLVTISDKPSGIGVISGTLASVSDASIWDRTNTLVVKFFSNTELSTVTEAELLSNPELNLLAVINPSTNVVEYLQFKTATESAATAPYIRQYTISTFLRGRAMTEHAVGSHTSADDVVVMDSTVIPQRFDSSELGHPLNFRFFTIGQGVDTAPSITRTLEGVSLKIPSPTGIKGTRDSGNDLLVEMYGRTRIGGGLRPLQAGAVNEEEEVYKVQILNSGSTTLPNGRERILTVIPGMQQAAVLYSSGKAFTGVTHNSFTPTTPRAASTYQQIHQAGNFIEGTFLYPSGGGIACFGLQQSGGDWHSIGTELNSWQSNFTAANTTVPGILAVPYLVILGGIIDQSNRLQVYEYGTKIFGASSHPAQADYDPDFGWDSTTSSGFVFRIRFEFVGSTVIVKKAHRADLPLVKIVAGSRRVEFPVFGVMGTDGTSPWGVNGVVMTTYPFPKTIYSATQQAEDGFTPGNAVQMDIWQWSRLIGDGVKIRVTL